MLGPWAVPDGTNANGTRARSTRGLDNEANMVATSSAQVESLQVGPVSDRAGDVCTPPLGIPLKAGEAVRRTEAGIPPGPPEKAASTQEGKVPFGQATSSRARAGEESKKCVGICNEKGISCERPEKLSGYLQVQARWWVRRKKDEHRRRTWKAEPLEAWRQGSASVYGEERLSRKRERCKSKVAFLKYK